MTRHTYDSTRLDKERARNTFFQVLAASGSRSAAPAPILRRTAARGRRRQRGNTPCSG
jgi:hypothetical protein